MKTIRKTVLHLFGAAGGGALGFRRARAEVAGMQGDWQCLGSLDIDAAANRVFAQRVGAPAITLDFADRSQYVAIHGHEPPPGWRVAVPADLHRATGGRRPDCVFLSAPCKGFSGLLPQSKSLHPKYAAMNGLAQRALWLVLEAWRDDPVPMILFENVPRLLTRGRHFADQLSAMLSAFGYLSRETVHDCGELGGLAQSRKRCLIVARHAELVPNFLYEPPHRPLRAVGDVLGRMPLPGAAEAGPLHQLPQLQWRTWVRLAFVQAGSDWRSLNRLAVVDGVLRDYLIVPQAFRGCLGVRRWDEHTGAVTGESLPLNGAHSVADPRAPEAAAQYQQYGVRAWGDTSGAISAQSAPGGGTYSVADPRCGGTLHNNAFRVVRFRDHAQAVTGGTGAVGGCVADPRNKGADFSKYAVADWNGPAGTVISGSTSGQGAHSVADPRSGMAADRAAYLSGGHYGVVRWDETAGAVSAAACHDNGRWSVADRRLPADHLPGIGKMPAADDRLIAVIQAEDGTWHRPFTTLELAALQSLFDPEDPVDVAAFCGAFTTHTSSDSQRREWIGNAVPPDAGQAIATEILRTLMLADAGETFALSAVPVWVRPYVAALQVAGRNPQETAP